MYYFIQFANLVRLFSEYLYRFFAYLYPWTGYKSLDKKLITVLPSLKSSKTFYIEVGANDGIRQSNTFCLERIYKATGLLIEASASNYERCLFNRSKRNIFEHCALVSSDYKLPYVEMSYSGLMSVSLDSRDVDPVVHAKKGLGFFNRFNYNFLAPAMTLDNLIIKHNIQQIDLLSLDVEGNELAVLKGAKLENKNILNILVEARNINEISEYLFSYGYKLTNQLSHHDYLFSI